MTYLVAALIGLSAHARPLRCFGVDRIKRNRSHHTYIINSWGFPGTTLVPLNPASEWMLDRLFVPGIGPAYAATTRLCLDGSVEGRTYYLWSIRAAEPTTKPAK